MESLSIIQKIIIWAIPVIFAVTLHEFAHGWVANRLGDPTARFLGRLSLNPIRHIDPIGTLLIPGILLIMKMPFIFGWAKPVPINWNNLRNPRRDVALVALAGPGSNLIMALMWGLIAKIGLSLGDISITYPIVYMGAAGIMINTILMVLNILPLPPLDGSRVVSSLLPPHLAMQYNRIEPFGFLILIILLATGVLGMILSGPFLWTLFSIKSLFGLPIQAFRF